MRSPAYIRAVRISPKKYCTCILSGAVAFNTAAHCAVVRASQLTLILATPLRTLPYLHWWSFLAWFDAIGEGSFATVVAIRDKLRRGKRLENWELDFYRTHRAAVELRSPASPAQETEKQRLLALLQ